MKNLTVLLAFMVYAAAGCSLLSVKPVPPASGPVFPLAPALSINYRGQVIPPGLKDGSHYYFTTDSGRVLAVDVRRREIAWEFRASFPISRPVCLGRECVYIVDDRNIVYCLDRSGWVLWSRGLSATVAGPLQEIEGRLYVGTEQGSLYCLQAESGLEAWRFQAQAALRTGVLLWKDRQGRLFILCGGDEGKLFFLDEGGKLRGDLDCGGKMALPPLLEKDRLYVGTEGQMFLCLDLQRRRAKWRVRLTGPPASPAIADQKRIFFLTAQGVLMSLNKRSGEILWWRTLSSRSGYNLEPADGQIVATSLGSDLVSFDARDGREAGRFPAGRDLRSNPVWLSPYLLVHVYSPQNEEGTLIFLRRKEAKDGQK
ncbi:MAG TPA: PQQ-binding-like beta-propeller repeat protein [Acidobacteriota bacterium]